MYISKIYSYWIHSILNNVYNLQLRFEINRSTSKFCCCFFCVQFSSDNGGDYGRGDNYPLRGFKNSSWEGGIRVPAFVTGGYLNENRRGKSLDDVLVHIVDWYPTLLSAAGIKVDYVKSQKLFNDLTPDKSFKNMEYDKIPLDGKDLWNAIQNNEISDDISINSRELLLDLDQVYCEFESCGAIRIGKYKFIRGAHIGSDGDLDGWNRYIIYKLFNHAKTY